MSDSGKYVESEALLKGDVDKSVHPDELGDAEEDDGINPEDFKKPTTNVYILTLEAAVKERAVAQGFSEADAAKVYEATFLLKDGEGKPTDRLQVAIGGYEGMFSRPGVQGFYLAPVNGEKDEYGRNKKFVRGSFWGCEQPKAPGISYAMSMSYGGGPHESLWKYAEAAIQPDRLAQADLVGLKTPPTAA